MKLSDLITHVGDENIQVQYLAASLVRASAKKHDVEITFATDKEKGQQILNSSVTGESPAYVGLVVWIPMAKWPKF